MKKLILILTIFAILGMAGLAFAQEKAPECCRLRRDFTEIDATCTARAWVGPAACGPNPDDPCYCPSEVTAITENWAACCFFNTFYTAATWVMAVLVAFSILIAIYGGYLIATSGGDPAKVDKGRNWILYAIVGLVIGAFARALPAIVRVIIR